MSLHEKPRTALHNITQLHVSQLIQALQVCNSDARVLMSHGSDGGLVTPIKITSWSGITRELTLSWEKIADLGGANTVGKLLATLNAQLGTMLDNVQGGHTQITLYKPLWADQWGTVTGSAVVGVESRGGGEIVVIQTWNFEY